MIDQHSNDLSGWAQFSDDMTMRFRLARSFTPFSPEMERLQGSPRVVFVMLNPSTADAFKLDPTVRRCVEFAKRWGADVLEVVNLFALRSPHPRDLLAGAKAARNIGANEANNAAIIAACQGATRVIAAWGRHGNLNHRDAFVSKMLVREGVKLEALRTTSDGVPMHPLARGKAFIPYDVEPAMLPWGLSP